jgi:hypothetical protein
MATRTLGLAAAAILSACGGRDGAPAAPVTGPPVPVPVPVPEVGCGASCLYVDARNGSDANDGRSRASAFATLDRAAREVRPGSTVLVMSGTYTSDGTKYPLVLSTSGTPDAWITFAAAPGEHPVIQIPRGAGAWAGIYLPGTSYVVIDGFEVVGQNGSISAAEAAGNDGTQAVLNEVCIYVDGAGFGDFHPPVPHDVVIRNCVVHGCSSAGIAANVADAITIAHNHVYDDAWWTVFGTSGISLYHPTDVPGSGTTAGYKNVIVGNLVHGNENRLPWKDGNPPGIYDGNGIIIDDGNHTQRPLGIADVQGKPYTGRSQVANNIVHDNGGRGIHTYSSSHVDIVNNTTWNNLLTASPHIGYGEIDAESCTDVNVVNNVAVNRNGKDANRADGGVYAYNVWYGPRVPYAGGAHDVVADPMLADPAGGDFAPLPGSPARRSGTSALAPTVDFFGNPRPPEAIDRGAVQVSR